MHIRSHSKPGQSIEYEHIYDEKKAYQEFNYFFFCEGKEFN
jgi:hypothetical protein